MKKIILFTLICSLLLVCFSGCVAPNDLDGEKESDTVSSPTINNDREIVFPDIIEGELDKNCDLVGSLVAYLEQYLSEYDLIDRTFAQKVDAIKGGIQPLHVAFDPTNYYFVCGYYNNPSSEYVDLGYSYCNEYTWVLYKRESEIKEYYNDIKWAVVFQINRASTITDIIPNEREVPQMEHFQIIKPTFENGVNIADPVVFDETFIYLNYPNCHLNKYSKNSNVMYYCKSIYYHPINTMDCVCLDDDYYVTFGLYTTYPNGNVSEGALIRELREYYDSLTKIMDTEKYNVTDEDGRTRFYGLVEINDLVKCING